ncbi:cation:proton antiporter [Methanolobus sp. ZRKC2]|uniref:cation:proton antiporter domain-containing protein n=1 Tax=Methanolobus sp. ZRKC2 TaxID=3125783 RepID=UPI00324596E1
MDSIYLIGLIVALLVMSLAAQSLSKTFKMPIIVFLLTLGIIAGPQVLNLLNPSVFGDGLTAIVSLSVAIIVFDGGLHINLKQMRTIQRSTLKLITIGVLITFALATIITYMIIGIPLELAALFGALVAATGPTVITPLVRQIRANHKVSKVLELEGILNDAGSVILAALVFEWIVSGLSGIDAINFILIRIGIGLTIGALSGILLSRFLSRGALISEQTIRMLTVTMVLATYVIAESVGNEAGILAVAIFGIIMGTSNVSQKSVIKEFKADIVVVMLSFIFIMLAAMLRFEDIINLGLEGIIVVMLLIFLVRPIAVFASTAGSSLRKNEKAFISFIGPRGVVPASIATYFAIKLDGLNIAGGQTLVGLVFLTVIITVVMTGTLSKTVAKILGVIPMEIILVGGGEVGRILAERFEKRGENVVVIDISEEKCQRLMKKGIRAVQGDAGDINILKKAGITNAKYIVSTTDQDNTNLLVCQIAKTKFGFKNEQIIARVNNMENLHAFWDLGIRAMSPAMSSAVILENMTGKPQMFAMSEIGEEGNIMETRVTNPKIVGKSIKELRLPENSLLVMIRRCEESIVANGNVILENNDLVTIIGTGDSTRQTANLLTG